MSLKHCACHQKVMPGHTKCCACRAKSSSQNWRSDAPKFTSLRKSAPWPNISDVSCTAPATENASLQILFKCPTPAIVFGHATKPSRFAHFWQGAQSLAQAARNDIWTSKRGPYRSFFALLTWKFCASCHNGVHFFDISKSKSWCLLSFWLGNVLPATTACTFRHLNFQKCSESGVCCTVWLGNVLRATTACNDVISHLATWLRTRHFSEPTFQPSGAANDSKNKVFRDFSLPFGAPAASFLWLFLFSDLLSSSLLFSSLPFPSLPFASLLFSSLLFSDSSLTLLWLFSSLTLLWLFSDSSHLCFGSVHIVGSLTAKLSSINELDPWSLFWRLGLRIERHRLSLVRWFLSKIFRACPNDLSGKYWLQRWCQLVLPDSKFMLRAIRYALPQYINIGAFQDVSSP